jgi:hypothetical protein
MRERLAQAVDSEGQSQGRGIEVMGRHGQVETIKIAQCVLPQM